MNNMHKLLCAFAAVVCFGATSAVNAGQEGLDVKKATAGTKTAFRIKGGDSELKLGGKAKIEGFYQDNMYMQNKNIPDENHYLKETIDLTLSAKYGKEKYGYTAAKFYADLRHKGIWGYGTTFADKDSGAMGPSSIRLSNSDFGTHSHTSGKPLIWFKEGWTKFALNAPFNLDGEKLHTLKLGWFPFEFGRGIALGSFYGLTKETLALYSASEDKAAPGIDLHGTILKDRLDYDVYYSKFENRCKNFSSVINLEKRYIVGRSATPWRGTAKDDDLIGGRLQWKALKYSTGNLELEPYIFYNAASDQKVEKLYAPDAKTKWGSYGLAVEYAYNNFECGAETAFNYGKEYLYHIDRNRAQLVNKDGYLAEVYTHILDGNPTPPGATPKPVLVTDATKPLAFQPNYVNGAQINATGMYNALNRFRDAYTNKLDGWMGVVDAAYNFKDLDLKVAAAYGYASGDANPHNVEKNKTYHGFVGLHECYTGKRVTSVLLLDERLLKRPSGFGTTPTANADMTFSDLHHAGLGITWTPKTSYIKDLSLNPNVIGFWKAHKEGKYNATTGTVSTTEKARSFMGTEYNLLSECSVVKNLKLFAKLALFVPGGYFSDIKGIPLSGDFFKDIIDDYRNDLEDASRFRIADDISYHVNVGFDFKF